MVWQQTKLANAKPCDEATQALAFAAFSKLFSVADGRTADDATSRLIRSLPLEFGLAAGIILVLLGGAGATSTLI